MGACALPTPDADMKAAVSDLLGINFRAIENPGVFFRRIQLLFSPTLEVELR